MSKDDIDDIQIQESGDNIYHRQEKSYERQLDASAKAIALSCGYR